MVETGDFVLPGKEVGFSEELIPGEGTYEEDGKIFSSATGLVSVNRDERKITVAPKTDVPPALKDGDKIIGTVFGLRSQVAIMEIVKIQGNDRRVPSKIPGGIHISKIQDSYVSEITSAFDIGDIILAKVVGAKRNPVQLSTVGPDLGVIKSYCPSCGEPLVVVDGKVTCRDCKKAPRKKFSSEYGKGLA